MASEAVLAGLLASGAGHPLVLFLVATTGNTLGSVVNFVLGRGVERFRQRAWFPLSPARYESARKHFARYGMWSLLFAWVPIIGDPLTFVAGALRVPFLPFLLLVAVGKAARYAMIVGGVAWWLA